MKKATLLIIFAISLILLFSPVFAGIGPSRVIIDFEPNLVKTITYTASTDSDITFEGELAPYASADKTELVNGDNTFTVTLRLPEKLDGPGTHGLDVKVTEKMPESEGMIAVRLAFIGQVWVQVPYPSKYLEITKFDYDISTDLTSFVATVKNLGDETISEVGGYIDFNGELYSDTVSFITQMNVQPTESRDLHIYWDKTNVPGGVYNITAIVTYDGDRTQTTRRVQIGELRLDILDVVTDVNKDLVKINVLTKSIWTNKIENVYAELQVFDLQGNLVDSAKSSVKIFEPRAEKELTIFWEPVIKNYDEYTYKIILNYEGKTTEKEIDIKGETTTSTGSFESMTVVALLIIIFIFGVLFLRKKKRRQQYYRYR